MKRLLTILILFAATVANAQKKVTVTLPTSSLQFPHTTGKYLNGFGAFAGLNTDSITEGSTNLFFTDTRSRASVSLTFTTTGSSGAATGSYNNGTGVFTINVPQYTLAGLGGFANPMTTEGDLILGGVSGTPTRLGIGANTYVLTSNGTTASWQAASGGGITALTGDVTASGSGSVAATLATVNSNVGSFTNANITVNAKGLITAASNGSGGGMTNPMTTTGDIIYSSDNSGTPARRAIGTTGQVLTVSGGLPTWSTVSSYIQYISASKSAVSNDGGNGGTGTNGGSDANAYNFFVGAGSGNAITSGIQNLGIGKNTLAANTSSSNSVAIGTNALAAYNGTTVQAPPTAIGSYALASFAPGATLSVGNLAIGDSALRNTTTGQSNTAIGTRALLKNITGDQNTAIGFVASQDATGQRNVDIGYQTGYARVAGNQNVNIGWRASGNASRTTPGNSSVYIGNEAGYGTSTASNGKNVGVGERALYAVTSGEANTAIGYYALNALTSGNGNIEINAWQPTGSGITSGNYNISIGDRAALPSATGSQQSNFGNVMLSNGNGSTVINGSGAPTSWIGALPTIKTSAAFEISSTTRGFLPPQVTTTQKNAISSPATGLEVYETDSKMLQSYNGSAWKSAGVVSGSYTTSASSQTVFTVTFGGTQPNTTYKVAVTPTASLSSALFYVTNKTTTTFDVTYLAALTGTVTFDYIISQ